MALIQYVFFNVDIYEDSSVAMVKGVLNYLFDEDQVIIIGKGKPNPDDCVFDVSKYNNFKGKLDVKVECEKRYELIGTFKYESLMINDILNFSRLFSNVLLIAKRYNSSIDDFIKEYKKFRPFTPDTVINRYQKMLKAGIEINNTQCSYSIIKEFENTFGGVYLDNLLIELNQDSLGPLAFKKEIT